MRFAKSAAGIASTASVVSTTLFCCIIAQQLSYGEHSLIALFVGATIGVTAGIIASRIWGRYPFCDYPPLHWWRDASISIAVLGGAVLIDVFVGALANPELPILVSAQMHAGFIVTLFVSPVALVPVVGGLRAFFVLLLKL